MKVALVCAPQTFGCNAGMYSVDLAAWYFFAKHFPDAEVTFSTLYPHECDFGGTPFHYACQYGEMQLLQASDLILYWGDFLHALHYRNEVAAQLVAQGIYSSPEQALAVVRRYLFLADGGAELRGKAVLYGGTLLFNQPDSYLDDGYVGDLERLTAAARGVWMREPFSTFELSQLHGRAGACRHGTDCAQLLGWDFLSSCPLGEDQLPPEASGIGVFLGRSEFDADIVTSFVSAVGSEMKLEASWLDWGRAPFFIDRRSEIRERLTPPRNASTGFHNPTPLQSLAVLRGFDLLISDTYHVCVNAWSFGIPAICLVDDVQPSLPVNRGSQTGGRDKRVVFYWTYNIAAFLVYASELTSEAALRKKVGQIVSLLHDHSILARAQASMSLHTRLSEQCLARVLRS